MSKDLLSGGLFKACTEERYWEMLGVLPPALQDRLGFLVGEPVDHRTCTVTHVVRPTFAAFLNIGSHYFESYRALTLPEYKYHSPCAEKLYKADVDDFFTDLRPA